MTYIEVERNVEVQVVSYEEREATEATFSSGPHAAAELPSYTREELEAGIDPEILEAIRRLFKPISGVKAPKLDLDDIRPHRLPTA